MRISTHFGDPQQWAHTHLSGVALGDVRRSRRLRETVRAKYLALAALGGHLGHKGDGPTGWQILWLGRRSLRLLVENV